MLQNEYLVAIVAVHTAENETLKIGGVSFHFFNHLLTKLPFSSVFDLCHLTFCPLEAMVICAKALQIQLSDSLRLWR